MNKILILIVTLMSSLFSCTSSSQVTNITVGQLKNYIKDSTEMVLIDVRTQEEYNEGNIIGSQLIPVDQILKGEWGALESVDKNKRIVVYCKSGKRSAMASNALVKAGYTHVENVLGGYQAWEANHE